MLCVCFLPYTLYIYRQRPNPELLYGYQHLRSLVVCLKNTSQLLVSRKTERERVLAAALIPASSLSPKVEQ